jgi:hypothetical protein
MAISLTGQGYDCQWGTDFSSSYFGIILPKSSKHSAKSKKKLLVDGNGNTVGTKHYDQMEEASLVFEPAAVSGNTGTVASVTLTPGQKVIILSSTNTHLTGSWQLDQLDDDGQQEGEMTQTANLYRYVNTTIT